MHAAGRRVVALALRIDAVTRAVGHAVRWLTLAIPLVCFGYAVLRKLLPWGHNGFSELQWHLFAMVYLLAAGYTLLQGQHVRVDFFWRRFALRTRCGIDIVFTLALAVVCVHLAVSSWDFWRVSLAQREGPEDVVIGLQRWPLKLALFLGFALLALQCVAELLKRWALLARWLPASAVYPDDAPPEPGPPRWT